jgi:uncharacterized protein
VGAAFWWGGSRLGINHDITAALPEKDPVVAAARDILRHHPALENVFVDIRFTREEPDRDALCDAGDAVSAALAGSGLVKVVTGRGGAETVSALFDLVTENLPSLLSREDLQGRVAPLIHTDRIKEILKDRQRELFRLDSLGRAKYLARDPLGLRNIPLERIHEAMPFKNGTLYRGHIISRDGRHLLIAAEPLGSPQDTDFARRLIRVLNSARALPEMAAARGGDLEMVYVGTFRAALDNETVIRRDTSRALALVMIGLAVLLLLCFRRFWIGILAAIPALAGIMLATFCYALLRDSIFALSLGFGGALISIAVDHGLTYVLLLDRPHETRALQVSRDVWSVASVTVLTTVVALLSLAATGIPLFAEVGLFAAMGVSLAAAFAHLFFPLLLPRLKGAKKLKRMPLERLADVLERTSNRYVLTALVVFALIMTLFIRFEFSVDLSRMNTLSPETLAAEKTVTEAWGDLSAQAHIMATGKDLDGLFNEMERLEEFLRHGQEKAALALTPPRAGVLPGPKAQKERLAAWKEFWTPERIMKLEKDLAATGPKLGFKANAFEPFLRLVRSPAPGPFNIPPRLMTPFGIFRDRLNGRWIFVEQVSPGASYDAGTFFQQSEKAGFRFFDPLHFSRHLAGELNSSFLKMLIMIGGVAVLMLFFLFADWRLLGVAIVPLAFSLAATLGTMGLLGLPLSIPSLMLAPILVGLGMDYGVYMARSCQRFGIDSRGHMGPFRLAILMGGMSTLVGTGSLALSHHAVLRSAGISTFLGIFYALVGTFGILPPLLRRIFRPAPTTGRLPRTGSREHTLLTLQRFRHLDPHPRFFARFKIMLDPMFPRLADFVEPGWNLLDMGCGYGVPAAWLLEAKPDLHITACDPDAERARVAARALGERAVVRNCGALDLHLEAGPVDAVLLLDMLHYLSDGELERLLGRLATLSGDGLNLIIRVTVPGKALTFLRFVETVRMRIKGQTPRFRPEGRMREILERAGFTVELTEPTAPGREETWFIARLNSP